VGGCPFRDAEDPGNLELDWLEVQLTDYRERNMQVRDFGGTTRPGIDWDLNCLGLGGWSVLHFKCHWSRPRDSCEIAGHVPPSPGNYFPDCVSEDRALFQGPD
jgi:hypothetical protein